jgi:hypothetical protein
MGHEAAVAPEPGECAFNNPTPLDNFKTALFVRALDDLEANLLRGQIGGEFVSLITAIGKDMFDEGEQAARLFDKVRRRIPVLDVRRNHLDAEEEADGVYKRIALDAFDLFARVIPNRIPAAPPFSVAFTACVSMTAAVGEASRPSALRQAISSS